MHQRIVHLITSFLLLWAGVQAQETENIPELATSLGLSTLVAKVVEADLAGALSGEGPFTVFGPTNEAFEALPPAAKEAVANKDVLTQILLYHVLSGAVPSSALADELVVPTLQGANARINLYPKGQTSFDVATVQCSPIDLSLVDQTASNGVIHVVKRVLLPPCGNITSYLRNNGFSTLVGALEATGLNTVLEGEGPFTLFAPTNAAFDKLPSIPSDVEVLKEILLSHVVSGTFCSAGLTSGTVTTASGKDVQVVVDANTGGVKVNSSNVIVVDGSVTNGVVHQIDTVIQAV